MTTSTTRLDDLLTELYFVKQSAGEDTPIQISPRYQFLNRVANDGDMDESWNPKPTEFLLRLRPAPELEGAPGFGSHGLDAIIPLVETRDGEWHTILNCAWRAPLGLPPKQDENGSWGSVGKLCIEFNPTMASDRDGSMKVAAARALRQKAGLSIDGDATFGPVTLLKDLGPAATHPGTENTLKTTMVCKLKYHGSDLESYRWHNAPRSLPNTSSKRVGSTAFSIPLKQMDEFVTAARAKGFVIDSPVRSHSPYMTKLGSEYVRMFENNNESQDAESDPTGWDTASTVAASIGASSK